MKRMLALIVLLIIPILASSEVDIIYEEQVLDFTQEGVEYQIYIRDADMIKLVFVDQTVDLSISNITTDSILISDRKISIGEEAIYELEEDIVISLDSVEEEVAKLTVKSANLSLWKNIFNFWWIGLLVLLLITAILLMRKTEYFKNIHLTKLLDRFKKHRSKRVISDKLYKKARRVINEKLKT